MATTGADLYTLFGEKIDKDYTTYINEARFNRLAKEMFIKLVDQIYRQKDTQKEHDELSELTVIDKEIGINSNRFHVRPLAISSITIAGLTLEITTADDHNLNAGDQVTLIDVQGLTTIPVLNATHTVVGIINSNTIQLLFTVPPTGAYTVGTGRMIHPKMLPDYYHLFAVKCQFQNSQKAFAITTLTGSSVVQISFTNKTVLRSGRQAVITGVVGTTNANGTFYLKQVGRREYELYYDSAMTQPVPVNAAYIEGGSVREIVYRYADRIPPDEKYSETQKATLREPKFIEDRSTILIYPDTYNCSLVSVDYLRKPSLELDANDSTVDLENTYSLKFLIRLKDEVADHFLAHIHEFQKLGVVKTLTMENR